MRRDHLPSSRAGCAMVALGVRRGFSLRYSITVPFVRLFPLLKNKTHLTHKRMGLGEN
jgi:hypothetical protein